MGYDTKHNQNLEKPWLFKPGVSGNPKGRPKRSPELKTAIQNLELGLYQTVTKLLDSPGEFKSETWLDSILEDLLKKGDHKNIFYMLERVIGKARSAIEIKVEQEPEGTGLEHIPTEKLIRIKAIYDEPTDCDKSDGGDGLIRDLD